MGERLFNSTFSEPNPPTARKGPEGVEVVPSARMALGDVSWLGGGSLSTSSLSQAALGLGHHLCVRKGVQGRALCLCPGFRAGGFPSRPGSGSWCCRAGLWRVSGSGSNCV